jgi:hypothetical protein
MTPADIVDRANRLRSALGEGVLDELLALTRGHIMHQWSVTGDADTAQREALFSRLRALDDIKTSFSAALGAGASSLANIAARKNPSN